MFRLVCGDCSSFWVTLLKQCRHLPHSISSLYCTIGLSNTFFLTVSSSYDSILPQRPSTSSCSNTEFHLETVHVSTSHTDSYDVYVMHGYFQESYSFLF